MEAVKASVETRRHPRYPCTIPVLCRSLSCERHVEVGMTYNVSLGGVMLDTPSLFHPQTPLEVSLMLGHRMVRAWAVVAWSAPVGTDVRHGLAFTLFPPEGWVVWEELIAYQAGPTSRASIRVPVEVPAGCRPYGEKTPLIPGQIVTIGEGGLALRLPERFPVTTRLSVEVPSGKGTCVVEGEVVWVLEGGSGPLIPHGIRFTADPLGRDLFLVAVLLQEFLRKSAVGLPAGRLH